MSEEFHVLIYKENLAQCLERKNIQKHDDPRILSGIVTLGALQTLSP